MFGEGGVYLEAGVIYGGHINRILIQLSETHGARRGKNGRDVKLLLMH